MRDTDVHAPVGDQAQTAFNSCFWFSYINIYVYILYTGEGNQLSAEQKESENLLAKATRQHRRSPRIMKLRSWYL